MSERQLRRKSCCSPRRGGALLAGLAVMLLGGSGADATLVRALSLGQLCAHAALVVEGRVRAVSEQRSARAPGVFRDHFVQVERVFKGTLPEGGEVVVRLPGGGLGGAQVVVTGTPRLNPGERVLLFLEPLPARAFPGERTRHLPLGLEQGVVFLSEGEGHEQAARRSFGARLLLPSTPGEPAIAPLPADAQELRRRVVERLGGLR